MNNSIQTIPILNLTLAFIPVLIAIAILFKWSLNSVNAVYAVVRMLLQLLLIGYFLTYIFESDSAAIVVLVMAIMVFFSSWIALGSLPARRQLLYKHAFWSIFLGGSITLLLMTQAVLVLEPWYKPQFMIPLAGMIFANSMNSISLAAERFNSEVERGLTYQDARNRAMQTALIPVLNSLFAVGLVSLPGMMTGQILSGISPLLAVRYQIMVMCMIFGSAAISTAYFLTLIKPAFVYQRSD